MKILLVEDDTLLAQGIITALKHFGYCVNWVAQGTKVMPALIKEEFALMILDLGLPDVDGIEVLKSIRTKQHNIPILILTARDQIEDKISGLDTGADDYMVKPFDVKELEARIRTLTRRSAQRRSDLIEIGRAVLDLNQRTLTFNGSPITFQRREFSLIQAFFERPKQVYTREVLENLAYSWDEEIESNSLEVHIHRLRKKLGNEAIKTIRGVGYMLVEDHFK